MKTGSIASSRREVYARDPISPYLFLIAAEGLSCLKSKVESSSFGGITVASMAPAVSHLLLLFFKADGGSVEGAKSVLREYCDASGQQVNLDKFSIHFAKGCSATARPDQRQIGRSQGSFK